jgi:hypothetical protein
MKLTKQQRHTAYIIMLVEAETGEWNYVGFCNLINLVMDIDVYEGDDFLAAFPELFKKRPIRTLSDGTKYTPIIWFPTGADGWQQRIALLKQCIEETA